MSELLSIVVGRHVTLVRKTATEHLGLCPFHNEMTPSFVVDDGAGRFHCFGCRADGDAAAFDLRMADKAGWQ